jgi:hypothetical protein
MTLQPVENWFNIENGDVEVYNVKTPDEAEKNTPPEPSKTTNDNLSLED